MSAPSDSPSGESAVGELEVKIARLEAEAILYRQKLQETVRGIQSRCQHQFQPVSKTHQLDDGGCVVVVGSQCPDGSGSMPVRCPKCSYMEDVDIRAHCLCGAKPKEVALAAGFSCSTSSGLKRSMTDLTNRHVPHALHSGGPFSKTEL